MSRVFDTFLFSGLGAEWDLLLWRLHELRDVVGRHVLVEATRTFQGAPRALCGPYIQQDPRFAPFLDRLTCVAVTDMPEHTPDAWPREHHQRAAIRRGLADAEPNDLILVSDVDEIPRASVVEYANRVIVSWPDALQPHAAFAFEQTLYQSWLNLACVGDAWPWAQCTRAVRYCWFTNGRTPQTLRSQADIWRIPDAGWHFSCLGGVEAMQAKLQAYSHWEWNIPAYNSRHNLAAAISEGRDWNTARALPFQFVPVDETFPRWLYEHRGDPAVARYIAPVEVPA